MYSIQSIQLYTIHLYTGYTSNLMYHPGSGHTAETNLEKCARECARDARVACSSVGRHAAATVAAAMAVDSVAEATEAATEAVVW